MSIRPINWYKFLTIVTLYSRALQAAKIVQAELYHDPVITWLDALFLESRI